ncbi:MAG TPA: phosphate/phosphite/phosphonate ABC transporter substrate-binding protein [Acidimicrobiia bacterium]|nr:phosphate/phosphite/phosphonate ABC transporter substrate-binding protein [Acidimicrobiia bacterium]
MKRSIVTLLLMALVLVACGDGGAETTAATTATTAATTTTAAPTTTTAAPEPELGTPENPIQVLFVPSVEAEVIVSGGEIMKAALEEATGLTFTVSVPTSYAATIEEMCAAPDRTMGFIPGLGYVLASNLCGVDVGFKAIRFGYDVYWAQFLVRRDSDLATLEDLAGLSWAYPDPGSTSGYMVPLLALQEAGVEPGATVEAGGHPQAALAVYRGDADFATTFYSPPLLPEGNWEEGDEPDIPADLIESCEVVTEGDSTQLWCGDYRVLDARASAREEAPDIVQQVRILQITEGIPNDTLSFGPDFPDDIRTQIEDALLAFAETPEWEESIGNQDFYGWTGISPADDAEYDGLRTIVDLVGISLDNI